MTSPYLLLVRSSSSSIGGLVMPSGAGATPDTGGRAPQLGVRAGGGGGPHGRLGCAADGGQGPAGGGAVSNRTNSSAARATSSLTTTTSNSPAASSSACASASRRDWTSGCSVPRPASRLTSSAQDGGARNTSCASGARARTCRAPCSSISSSAGDPEVSCSCTGATGVPYRLPAYSAHSSSPSLAISQSK